MEESSSLEFRLEYHADMWTIKTLVDWVYTKLKNSAHSILDRDLVPNGFVYVERAYTLLHLADYLQMPQLQNDVMRLLFRERKHNTTFAFFYGTGLEGLAKGCRLFDYHTMMLAADTAQYVDEDEHGLLRDYLERQSQEALVEMALHPATHHEKSANVYKLEDLLVEEFC